VIDYERVVRQMKRQILTKSSWGQRDLLALIGRLEAENDAHQEGFDPAPRRMTGRNGGSRRVA